jgi:signal peptidase II
MNRTLFILFLAATVIFGTDQAIKLLFLEGFRWQSDVFSLILTYNKGVAFSMFAFLQEYLKYLQLLLLAGVGAYLFFHKDIVVEHRLAIGIIAGAAFSNLLDRFVHGGVVDYFFWHYGFEFAVFNFADVMIDLGVLLILYRSWKTQKTEKNG